MEITPPTTEIIAVDPSRKIAAIRSVTTGLEFFESLLALQQEETANPKDTVSIVSSKCFSKKANYLRNSVLRIMVP